MMGTGDTGNELQTLVEALSLAIGQPVLLDDAALTPIAYSPQWGEIDPVRQSSILGRGVSRQVRDALLEQGIAKATRPIRTNAVPEIEMVERVCVPVRAGGSTVGFLWLVDPSGSISGETIERAQEAAASAAELLAARPDASLSEETPLVGSLCSSDEAERDQAREQVLAEGLFADRPLVVVRLAMAGPATRLGDLARRIVHRVSAGHALAGRLPDGLLILLSLEEPALSVLEPSELARWVHGAADRPVAVGESGTGGGLADVPEARRQAELALSVARARPDGAQFAAWGTLGADRLTAQIPFGVARDIPDRLRRLLADEPELAATLAAFLDSAGDIKRTAEELSLHRSGLYYRLRRIEELSGLDLAVGDDRLLAHLAVRLAERSS